MPTYSAWYTDVEVTATFAEWTDLRTGAVDYRSKNYPDTFGHLGPPTNAGLDTAVAAMEALTPELAQNNFFVLDDLYLNGREGVGANGGALSGNAYYSAVRNQYIAAWTTLGRSPYQYVDLISDLPGYVDGAELEWMDETYSATVVDLDGTALYAGAYYAGPGGTVFGNYGVAHLTSPEITWGEGGTFTADATDNIVLASVDASTADPIPDFPWTSLINSDGKTVSVSGVVESYTVPDAAVTTFYFGSPLIAVESVTVILPPYRWYGDVVPPDDPVIPRVLRRYPRDDPYGFGGVGRIYPPPRRGRTFSQQP